MKVPLLWWVGGAGLVGAGILAYFEADNLESAAQAIGSRVEQTAFTTALSVMGSAAAPFGAALWKASQDSGISPFILYGIGAHESAWGAYLKPKNDPHGTGDFIVRAPNAPSVRSLPAASLTRVSDVPDGWTTGTYSGPGPWVIPSDGMGWGRGLAQIDYGNSLNVNWADPYTAIMNMANRLKANRAQLQGKVPPDQLDKAMIVAYNKGVAGVLDNVANGVDLQMGTQPANNYYDLVAKWVAKIHDAIS